MLNENLPHAFRGHLPNHDTVTAAYAGLSGCKNGELLKAAEEAGFEVLVTGDQTLQYEQNLTGAHIAIILLSTNAWLLIRPHVDKIATAVDRAESGSFTTVECGKFTRKRPGSAPSIGP